MEWFIENEGEAEAAAYIAQNPAYQDEPVITAEMVNAAVYEGSASGSDGTYDQTLSESLNRGTSNSLPLVSTDMQTDFGSLIKKLGSVGSAARDLGTAFGSIQRAVTQAPKEFETARANAASGNKAQQWLQYSSTQDKLTVGIAAAGLLYLIFGPK